MLAHAVVRGPDSLRFSMRDTFSWLIGYAHLRLFPVLAQIL